MEFWGAPARSQPISGHFTSNIGQDFAGSADRSDRRRQSAPRRTSVAALSQPRPSIISSQASSEALDVALSLHKAQNINLHHEIYKPYDKLTV
ncbi:hypothetical protein M2360_001730 [Rhizobium sp. SG_E_25_P2]|jgi:hypothetical protein|uniref:hypothetical protein n=1 Tax=Rhizobium sp. SG_E_25_P2 TaxID=2879942 RepID=UPI00247394D0|nr:hypothetical protein [Rhizobium sp. SG_E_25_P2]MDH6266334.1 hypothetical protein [Rhizobium sp. SG_E_25_P2]